MVIFYFKIKHDNDYGLHDGNEEWFFMQICNIARNFKI